MARQGLEAAAAFAGAGCRICCACHGQEKHPNKSACKTQALVINLFSHKVSLKQTES